MKKSQLIWVASVPTYDDNGNIIKVPYGIQKRNKHEYMVIRKKGEIEDYLKCEKLEEASFAIWALFGKIKGVEFFG